MNPRYIAVRRFSRPDPSTARTSLRIDFSIIWTFLEFLLDIRFLKHREVCKKPDFIRVFRALASEILTTFQDRLVMTTSITLRKEYITNVWDGAVLTRRSCPPRSHRRYEIKSQICSQKLRALRGIATRKEPAGLFSLAHPL